MSIHTSFLGIINNYRLIVELENPLIRAAVWTLKKHGMEIEGQVIKIQVNVLSYTHTLEESKLVKISSNVSRETRFTYKLRVSFLVCFDDIPHQKVLKGSSLD